MPEGPSRARALAIWTAAGAAGGATGLAAGGLVTELVTWRWLFYLNLPIIGIALAIAPRLAPTHLPHASGTGLLVIRSLLLPAGSFAIVGGLTNAQTHGLGDRLVTIPFLAGMALLGLFARSQVSGRNVLIPIRVLTRLDLRMAAMVAFTITFVTSSAGILITYWLQDVHGMSAGQVGLILLPSSIGVIVGAGIGSKALGALTSGRSMIAGLLMLATATAGQILCLEAGAVGTLLACFALSGIGLGWASVAATDHGLSGTDAIDKGVASGILSSAAPIGTALGIALLTTIASILASAIATGPTPSGNDATAGYQAALGAALFATFASAAVIRLRVRPRIQESAATPRLSRDRSSSPT